MKYGKYILVIGATSILFSSMALIRFKIMPYYKSRRLQEAEGYADLLYKSQSK